MRGAYQAVEPGIYHAVIEVLDSEGFLILGMQKQFEVTETSNTSYWAPTATFSSDIKKTYDGPVEDCPYLQGKFTIDIKGLFEGFAPTIPIDDQHAVMAINRELTEIYEREDVSPPGQQPLIVEAETFPSCNLTEEEHELGFLSTYFDATDTGYTAYVGDTFTNIDNRWPLLIWNRTGFGDPQFCPDYDIDINVTHLGGRYAEPQRFPRVPSGDSRKFLARNETVYRDTYVNSDTGDVLLESNLEIPFITDKGELFGVEAWGHIVGYEPGCEGGVFPRSGPLRQQNADPDGNAETVFEGAESPWLDRQAPRSGEFGW